MQDCTEAKLIKKTNLFERYTYIILHVSWPGTDRDNVVYSVIRQDEKSRAVTISLIGKPDYFPQRKNLVRIPVMNTLWTFQPLQSGKIKIIYQTNSDPGGRLPAAIVNLAIVDMPFFTLLRLREIIKEGKYARAIYPEIKEPYEK
jgi:hypothetical protein